MGSLTSLQVTFQLPIPSDFHAQQALTKCSQSFEPNRPKLGIGVEFACTHGARHKGGENVEKNTLSFCPISQKSCRQMFLVGFRVDL